MILEWILLIPNTGFHQRPLLWFYVNSYTLNGPLFFEKGFGKLLKSCTKREILEIRVLFHANCAAGLLEGKVTKPLCFQIYHKLRQDFRLTRSKKVPALARSSRADLFPGKTLWPLHPPHQLRPRCGTRNRNSAEKFQHSTTQNFPILACFLPQKGTPASLGPGLWSF